MPTDPDKRGGADDAAPIAEETLRAWFAQAQDIHIRTVRYDGPDKRSAEIVLLYVAGMIDNKLLNDIVLPRLRLLYDLTGFADDCALAPKSDLPLLPMTREEARSGTLAAALFGGCLGLFLPSSQSFWTLDLASPPSRRPEESNTEVSIRGPKDGFVETLADNIALVRRRLPTTRLVCERYTIGRDSRTGVALLYMKDLAPPHVIEEVKRKLEKIEVDAIVSNTQLEYALTGKRPLFPLFAYTGRPDFASECLLKGRFLVAVDGNPMLSIAPANLFLLLKSPEDAYFHFMYVSFGRLLRLASLLISIFLPGFFIAFSTFHMDQIPFPLLATITNSRLGLPLSAAQEMFFILFLLELFREAGVRLPSAIGQTLTVVGGLIIGDAAIRAGLISPTMVVMTAITFVSGSTLVNQSLSSNASLLRFTVFFLSAILGMFGFLFSFIALAVYLGTLRSFGMPYLSPIGPPNFHDIPGALAKFPWTKRERRPAALQTGRDGDRGGQPS